VRLDTRGTHSRARRAPRIVQELAEFFGVRPKPRFRHLRVWLLRCQRKRETFNQARHAAGEDGDDCQTEALLWATTQIFRQATVAAIFGLALIQRAHLAAHQN
jgi:hypothetical protein